MWRFGFRKPSAGALWGWRRCCCDVQTETRWLSGWLKASQTLWSLAPGEAVHAEERLALESVGARKDAAGQLGHGGRTRTAGQNLPPFPSHVHTKVLELRTAFLLNESTSKCLVKFPFQSVNVSSNVRLSEPAAGEASLDAPMIGPQSSVRTVKHSSAGMAAMETCCRPRRRPLVSWQRDVMDHTAGTSIRASRC